MIVKVLRTATKEGKCGGVIWNELPNLFLFLPILDDIPTLHKWKTTLKIIIQFDILAVLLCLRLFDALLCIILSSLCKRVFDIC